MTTRADALARLRSPLAPSVGDLGDVRFAALGGHLERRWRQAGEELQLCIHPVAGSAPILNEGGIYHGSWMESTATINAQVLDRFAPEVTRATHLLFAEHQRADGLLPYKVTDDGPAFSQIQIVTPLARCVWHHYRHAGAGTEYLRTMYDAMVRMDEWLVAYRDTRGTGAVEAFCTFDTGHDLSPRFWHVPDRCFEGEASKVDPTSPILPFVAPDLTANVACQRAYLALIAAELGHDGAPWRERAAASSRALHEQCFAQDRGMYFDRDATGALVPIESDVLLRVLACEIGDDEFFTAALERYLMNTGKFFANYGFTSIAMDDPRFDADYTRNSWAGPSNFLSMLRAPDAFERHGRSAELALSAMAVLSAVAAAQTFPQCLDPWTGAAGFTSTYSPAILWMLDAVERHFGIMPTAEGNVWFSGLMPTTLDHGSAAAAVAYGRTVDATRWELAGDDTQVEVLRDGEPWLTFPRGWRVVTDPTGGVVEVVCLSGTVVSGELVAATAAGRRSRTLTLGPNDRAALGPGGDISVTRVGLVAPRA